MSVRRAQIEIDSREFTEWMAYDSIDPFGPERQDLHAGIIASTIANANSKKRFKPSDFMPKFGWATKVKQTVSEMAKIVLAGVNRIRKRKGKKEWPL